MVISEDAKSEENIGDINSPRPSGHTSVASITTGPTGNIRITRATGPTDIKGFGQTDTTGGFTGPSGNTGFNDSDVEKTSGVNSDNDEDDLDLENRITDRYGFFVTDKFHQAYAGEITEAESRAIREKEVKLRNGRHCHLSTHIK